MGLIASGIRVAFAGQDVLHGVDLTVSPRVRMGLIGPNGAGKSTLLRVLAGEHQPDAGSVTRTGTVGFLPQEATRRPGETMRAHLARRTGVADAEAEMERTAMALGEATDAAAQAYDDALQRWMDLGGADFDARVEAMVVELGLDPSTLDVETTGLSGGQMARASLAAVLLSRHDVLLLDEPTNDLDLDGLDRLEQFVLGLRGGLVVVSHDREFLSRTITEVLELDPVNASWSLFAGGWDAYLVEREVTRRQFRERYEASETRREALIDRVQAAREQSVRGSLRAKNRASDNDKVAKGARLEASTKGAQRVRALETRLSHLDREDTPEPRKEWELRLELPEAPRSGDVVAQLRDVVARRGDFTLGPLTVDLAQGDRVRILGPNGGGKSTLLSVLLGHLVPDEGTATLGSRIVVGELDQARAALGTDGTVVDLLMARSDMEIAEARTLLAKFGLRGPRATRPAAALSPGERTRAMLALLMAGGTNLLVLDEPTNHLDMSAIEQLESALARYGGTLLLVSHDRRLLDAVETTRTWHVAAGTVEVAR
ncbi:ABC-F family ATP-binding cassette domain-containing protein [soil metagenome]